MEQTSATAKELSRQLRHSINRFLDGSSRTGFFKSKGKSFRVGKKRQHPIISPTIVELCAELGMDSGLSSLGDLEETDSLCVFLQSIEEPLGKILLRDPSNHQSIHIEKDFRGDDFIGTRFEKLPEIFKPFHEPETSGLDIYLHGSMADLKFTAFSDVDDLIVLTREAWAHPTRLRRSLALLKTAARGFQDLDPYQHHGHWLITEFDLLAYDESIMPTVVLDHAKRIVGRDRLPINIISNRNGFIGHAENTIKSMRRTMAGITLKGGLNAFQLKGLVGEIAIMPAYLFQAGGEKITKPEAIGRSGELFSIAAMAALRWATFVRDHYVSLVENPRTRALQTYVNLFCKHRSQAEAIFRKYSVYVNKEHRLGVNDQACSAIDAFIRETCEHISKVQSECS